jgi:hypothetical protein
MGLVFGAETSWARQESFLVLVLGPDSCPEARGGSRGWLRLGGGGATMSGILRVGLGCWWRMANGGDRVRKFLLSWGAGPNTGREVGNSEAGSECFPVCWGAGQLNWRWRQSVNFWWAGPEVWRERRGLKFHPR